jgi:hypothetical protein
MREGFLENRNLVILSRLVFSAIASNIQDDIFIISAISPGEEIFPDSVVTADTITTVNTWERHLSARACT